MPRIGSRYNPLMYCTDTTSVYVGDCIEVMSGLPEGSVDTVFADPPFNIKYKYDVYEDSKSVIEYMDWTSNWIRAMLGVLKPNGSFWLAMGDEFASDIDVVVRRVHGLVRRSWVIWHYTFGVNCPRKFTPSHTHLFHYVRDPKDFTFNADAVRVPSYRARVGDKRAKPGGRLPDDVWNLRPQESDGFTVDFDTWYVPRVAGTHSERTEHPCQMPEAILERILRVSSNEGDLVLDPFLGSGTTSVVAERIGRRSVGVELSKNYVDEVIVPRLRSRTLE